MKRREPQPSISAVKLTFGFQFRHPVARVNGRHCLINNATADIKSPLDPTLNNNSNNNNNNNNKRMKSLHSPIEEAAIVPRRINRRRVAPMQPVPRQWIPIRAGRWRRGGRRGGGKRPLRASNPSVSNPKRKPIKSRLSQPVDSFNHRPDSINQPIVNPYQIIMN